MTTTPPTTNASLKAMLDGECLSLKDAEAITGVPHDTLISAHGAGRLRIERVLELEHDIMRWVHAYDLTYYMVNSAPEHYRWHPTPAEIAKITAREPIQLRIGGIKDKRVNEIANNARMGTPITPIWTIHDETGVEIICDGSNRVAACKLLGRTSIDRIHITLPSKFGKAISRVVNSTHGENLDTPSKAKALADFFNERPGLEADLRAGAVTQSLVAKITRCLPMDVSLALAKKKPMVPVDARAVHAETQLLDHHLDHQGQNRLNTVTVLKYKVFSAAYHQIPVEERREIERIISQDASPVCNDIGPNMRSVLKRRGGDRRVVKPAA